MKTVWKSMIDLSAAFDEMKRYEEYLDQAKQQFYQARKDCEKSINDYQPRIEAGNYSFGSTIFAIEEDEQSFLLSIQIFEEKNRSALELPGYQEWLDEGKGKVS